MYVIVEKAQVCLCLLKQCAWSATSLASKRHALDGGMSLLDHRLYSASFSIKLLSYMYIVHAIYN